jgi:6-phosphofructokinase 1
MTTGRWYIVVAMGRSAGHLSLGIGKSAGATLTIIPEEFPGKGKIPARLLADIIVGAMIKRLAEGRAHGVAVVAEGLLERIRTEDLEHLGCLDLDDHGHVRYGEIDFANVLKKEVQIVLDELKIKMPITTKDVGYELRCAPPIAYDVDYTRNLGYAAFEFLRNGGSNAMITIQNNAIVPVSFKDIEDPVTKKTRVRLVNTDSVSYKIARKYMIRLDPDDFDQGIEFDQIALASNLPKEEFKKRFQYVTKY